MNYYLNAFNEMLRRQQENQMGRGGDGRSANPQFDALTNAEKAAYYADNPTMAAITQFGQKALGYAPFGIGMAMQAQKAFAPDFVREQEAIAKGFPSVEAYAGSRNFGKESSLPAEGVVSPGMPAPKSNNFMDTLSRMFSGSSVQLDPVPFETRTATPNPYAGENPALSSTGSGFAGADIGSGGGFTGGVATGDSGGSPADAANLGYNQGGMVTPERLMGRAPAPDDGYGALQGGEYVITKAAVEKYGKRMMDAINNGTFR